MIAAGGWDTSPGTAGAATRDIQDKFVLGTRCAYGDCLANFASVKRLVA